MRSKNGSRWQNNDQFCSHCAREVLYANIEPFSDSQTQKMTEISIFFEIVRLGDFTRKYKIFSDVIIPQNGSDTTYLTRSETVTQFSVLFLLKNTPDLNRYQENRYLGRICILFRHIQPYIQPINLRLFNFLQNLTELKILK